MRKLIGMGDGDERAGPVLTMNRTASEESSGGRSTIQGLTRPISFSARPWSDRQFDHFLVPTHKLGESLVNVSAGDADVRRDELSTGDMLPILLATAH